MNEDGKDVLDFLDKENQDSEFTVEGIQTQFDNIELGLQEMALALNLVGLICIYVGKDGQLQATNIGDESTINLMNSAYVTHIKNSKKEE